MGITDHRLQTVAIRRPMYIVGRERGIPKLQKAAYCWQLLQGGFHKSIVGSRFSFGPIGTFVRRL